MFVYSPLGVDWLNWHSQKISNFAEFLKINGYFSFYGFSIWDDCENCSLDRNSWGQDIYISTSLFTYFHYLILNDFFGNDFLRAFGHFLDKIIIFISGVLLAEIYLKLSKNSESSQYIYSKALLIFIFYFTNPWTYKMILAGWHIIFFVNFILLSIILSLNEKKVISYFFIFLAACIDYQSSAGLIFYYLFIFIFFSLKEKKLSINDFILFKNGNGSFDYKIYYLLFTPILFFFIIKFIAVSQLQYHDGSSLLYRVGISGNDIHNGGVLGALQFLGGNRITLCFENLINNLSFLDFDSKIEIFNCTLSILGMFFISGLSILGLFYLCREEKFFFNIIILPFTFLLLCYTFILQQSSSAHLMGYSYFFSILFSVGITKLIFVIFNKANFSETSLILMFPPIIGIILLSIRVSMLTGPYG